MPVLFVCSICLLSGCQSSEAISRESFDTGDKVSLIDAYGREVFVPEKVNSVAVYGRGSARMMVYAGGVDKITGVSDMDKDSVPWMPYAAVNAEKFSSLPSVGAGGSKDIAYDEALVELAPDVVVSTYGNSENLALQEKTGIPVVGVKCQNMVFDEDLYNSINLLGGLFDASDRAEATVSSLKRFEADLADRTFDLPDEERVTAYVGGVNYLGPKSLNGTFVRYAPFDAVGIINVADSIESEGGAFDIDLEMLGEWEPDLIFCQPS